MKGVGVSHLTRISIGSIKKFFNYLQDAVPGKLRAIHVLNVVWFFDKILQMIKPFMKADILECVSIYSYIQTVFNSSLHCSCICIHRALTLRNSTKITSQNRVFHQTMVAIWTQLQNCTISTAKKLKACEAFSWLKNNRQR